MRAFVDESLRAAGGALYLVAVAVVAPEDLDDYRAAARGVLLPRQPKFHWRGESERQRRAMLDAIAELEPNVFAYSTTFPRSRQERARARCVKRMLWDFVDQSVDRVTFESRGYGDAHDARSVENARRARALPPGLSYAFVRAKEEPILWIADALAGAAAAHVTDEKPYLDGLPPGLVHVVEL